MLNRTAVLSIPFLVASLATCFAQTPATFNETLDTVLEGYHTGLEQVVAYLDALPAGA